MFAVAEIADRDDCRKKGFNLAYGFRVISVHQVRVVFGSGGVRPRLFTSWLIKKQKFMDWDQSRNNLQKRALHNLVASVRKDLIF